MENNPTSNPKEITNETNDATERESLDATLNPEQADEDTPICWTYTPYVCSEKQASETEPQTLEGKIPSSIRYVGPNGYLHDTPVQAYVRVRF